MIRLDALAAALAATLDPRAASRVEAHRPDPGIDDDEDDEDERPIGDPDDDEDWDEDDDDEDDEEPLRVTPA